jgi:hypothetical protein
LRVAAHSYQIVPRFSSVSHLADLSRVNAMFIATDDQYIDQLADTINCDLSELRREVAAETQSFGSCSLTLTGPCSPKNRSGAKPSRSRSCRRTTQGKSSDPDHESQFIIASLWRPSP